MKTEKNLPSNNVIMAAGIAAERCQTVLSDAAISFILEELSQYPEHVVIKALKRCEREVKAGRFCFAEVRERIEDGHPGVEAAWAIACRAGDEGETIVWTTVMADAFRVVQPLVNLGDMIGARMAFKEQYGGRLEDARMQHTMADWTASLGHDTDKRSIALACAEQQGLLSQEACRELAPPDLLQLAVDEGREAQERARQGLPMLTFDESFEQRNARAALAALANDLRGNEARVAAENWRRATEKREAMAAEKSRINAQVSKYTQGVEHARG